MTTIALAPTTSAELFKVVRRPANWTLLGAWLVLYLTFSYVAPYLGYLDADRSDPRAVASTLGAVLPGQLVSNAISGYAIFGGALALVFGALVTGSEYGWDTMKTLLTRRPSRLSIVAGKVGMLVVAAFVTVAVTFVLGAAVSAGLAAAENQPFTWPSIVDLLTGFGVGWLVATMWMVGGAMLGTLFRGVAMPIGLGVVWVLGVENLLRAVATDLLPALRPVRDLLPGVNAGSAIGWATADLAPAGEVTPGVNTDVAGGRALITLALYVAGFVVATALVARRRDVS